MKRYNLVFYIIVIFLISFSTTVSGEEPIDRAINWLYVHQNPDYSWGDEQDIVNQYHATAAVLNAFWAFGIEDSTAIKARMWLTQQPRANVDYLSRFIEIISHDEPDTSGLVDSLVLMQNADGGFGLCLDYQSDN